MFILLDPLQKYFYGKIKDLLSDLTKYEIFTSP